MLGTVHKGAQANFTQLNNIPSDSEIRCTLQLTNLYWCGWVVSEPLEVACILSSWTQGWRQFFPASSWLFRQTVQGNIKSWASERKPLCLCRDRKRQNIASLFHFSSIHISLVDHRYKEQSYLFTMSACLNALIWVVFLAIALLDGQTDGCSCCWLTRLNVHERQASWNGLCNRSVNLSPGRKTCSGSCCNK